MKRHPDLRTLSDDHHQGLVHARRLKRAATGEDDEPADTTRPSSSSGEWTPASISARKRRFYSRCWRVTGET
jgi:hypothetical protein